jgi:prophage regulatory protein
MQQQTRSQLAGTCLLPQAGKLCPPSPPQPLAQHGDLHQQGYGLDPILRLNAVLEITAQKQATWYRYMKLGLAPKSVKLGPNTVGWRLSDIKRWLETRPHA